MTDFDPRSKARAAELRAVMKGASKEIANDPARMRVAEREGIAPQVRNFVRQVERDRILAKGNDKTRYEGLNVDQPEPLSIRNIACNIM